MYHIFCSYTPELPQKTANRYFYLGLIPVGSRLDSTPIQDYPAGSLEGQGLADKSDIAVTKMNPVVGGTAWEAENGWKFEVR